MTPPPDSPPSSLRAPRFFPSLRSRQRQPEWMDDPRADPAELRRSLMYIRRVNALLGYTREMARVARRGIVAADLLRHRRAYAWITLFTLTAGPMVRHDARASVAQAFNKAEVLRLRDAAGVGFARYYRHFGHRFALAGER